jgi:DNA-binding transcriptional regulator GbsR (MarR family)
MKAETLQKFVDAWGAMGNLWGINRSVARVHALLMASQEPLSLDDIAVRLSISRGNASMSLRELRNFGVTRQIPMAGDRRDYYVTEPDVWTLFFRILSERKRREFDPAIKAIRELLAETDPPAAIRDRLEEMATLLTTLDTLANRFLTDPQSSRAALMLLLGLAAPGGGND